MVLLPSCMPNYPRPYRPFHFSELLLILRLYNWERAGRVSSFSLCFLLLLRIYILCFDYFFTLLPSKLQWSLFKLSITNYSVCMQAAFSRKKSKLFNKRDCWEKALIKCRVKKSSSSSPTLSEKCQPTARVKVWFCFSWKLVFFLDK